MDVCKEREASIAVGVQRYGTRGTEYFWRNRY